MKLYLDSAEEGSIISHLTTGTWGTPTAAAAARPVIAVGNQNEITPRGIICDIHGIFDKFLTRRSGYQTGLRLW